MTRNFRYNARVIADYDYVKVFSFAMLDTKLLQKDDDDLYTDHL